MKVLNIEETKGRYSFLFGDEKNNTDVYFCNCGTITKTIKSENSFLTKGDIFGDDEKNEDEYNDVFKAIKLSENDVICNGCGKNFASIESQKKLIVNNSFFTSGYNILEDTDNLFLYYSKIKPNIKPRENKNGEYDLLFDESQKYLRYETKSNRVFFKDFCVDETEFHLDGVIKTVDAIFSEEVNEIQNIYYIHVYINKLAKHVIDVKNINVVDELLSEIRSNHGNAGLGVIKKIVSIFLAIIKYTNLSTIAMTKGCNFLYELMKECEIPDSKSLKELSLTSPISIFNFLIKNYIRIINEDVNADNRELHQFLFKSSKAKTTDFEQEKVASYKELKINFIQNKKYREGKLIKNINKNKFHVLQISSDAEVSKFIYKKINNFSDYKQLLKYFKFYNKQQIIYLLQKYEIDLLVNIIDLIYFRDSVDMKEFERIISIIKDYAFQETIKNRPTLNIESVTIDYYYIKKFDFIYYDDSVMMMEVLKFDPKRHFNKIKTYHQLVDYHDNLVKYFNVVSDKEKNEKFKSFVERFVFLESREDYDGPIEIKLIKTPSMLINEGIQMKHSASSYSKKVITESYVIAQLFDKSDDKPKDDLDRFTIGFTFDSLNGLEFHQIKGFANKPASDRLKKMLMEYLTIKDISFRQVRDLRTKG